MRKYLFILLPVILFFALRLTGLGTDLSNSDEARWHRRSINFLTALKSRHFEDTYQHYQPGVTLMWLDAVNFQLNRSWPYLENYDVYPVIRRNTQILITTVLGLTFALQLILLSKLYTNKLALIYGLIAAVEPYLLGIDRWVHLTSFETYFSFTALLLLLLYIKDINELHTNVNTLNKKLPLLVFSAVFLSLAVLSKITAIIMLPVFLGIFLWSTRIKEAQLYFVIFMFCFVLFFPAIWVNPIGVFSKIYSAVAGAVSDDVRSTYFTGLSSIFYYPVILLFKLSPITVILFIVSAIRNWRHPALFIFLYILIILTLADKKIDRYVLIMFPYILLIASTLLAKLSNKLLYSLGLLYGGFTLFVILTLYPVYSFYYSPILGGYNFALKTGFYENSGEFFADAARYLNTLGRNNIVFVPDNIESFNYFYGGKSTANFNANVKYVVTSVDFDRPLPRSEYCPTLEKQFHTVYIYKCN